MRGSPILRSFLLLLVLVGTGLWIAQVTRPRDVASRPSAPAVETKSDAVTNRIPYRLLLSAPAERIAVGTLDGAAASSALRGELEVSSDAPVLTLLVRWQDEAREGVHRFAKLILEIPGRETIEHVFDASGDIDDVWEVLPPATAP